MRTESYASSSGSSLNTLAQSETAPTQQKKNKGRIAINGKGSLLQDRKALFARSKKKLVTLKLVLALIDIAHEKGDYDREKAFWRVYHCQEQIITANNLAFAKYCKGRICAYCCGVRKARMINRYYPELKKWKDPHFLTLTVRSIRKKNLHKWIGEGLLGGFAMIVAKYRKRHQRGTGIKLIGIRSLECNYNPQKGTYNPHLHVIVPDKKTAEILRDEWLSLWTEKHALSVAQFIRPALDLERDLIEIIKYSSKIFTNPENKKKVGKNKTHFIYAHALYNILAAMEGHRIFDRFGFDLPKSNKKTAKCNLFENHEEFEYNPKKADWQNVTDSDDLLVKMFLPDELIELLENRIEKDLE